MRSRGLVAVAVALMCAVDGRSSTAVPIPKKYSNWVTENNATFAKAANIKLPRKGHAVRRCGVGKCKHFRSRLYLESNLLLAQGNTTKATIFARLAQPENTR